MDVFLISYGMNPFRVLNPSTHDRRPREPPRVADRVEQRQRFLHTIHRLVLVELLIVFRNGDEEDYVEERGGENGKQRILGD